jgi:hypothetical protein
MALSTSKKIRCRLLITFARLLRIPVAIHQSFFIASASDYREYSDIERPVEHTPLPID